jgi:hypothetical protein
MPKGFAALLAVNGENSAAKISDDLLRQRVWVPLSRE